MTIKKRIINILSYALLIVGAVVSIVLVIFSVKSFLDANSFGAAIGTQAGRNAGKLSGSYYGITEGLEEGKAAGIDKGLSAEDTKADVGNKIRSIGNLEVLSASVVLHDVLEIGDEYKTLLAFYGDITFTVDLMQAEYHVSDDAKTVDVILPKPQATLRIDDRKSEQLDSAMKHSWSGSNQKGYTAVINSIKELTLNAEDEVSNYDILMNDAQNSAIKQVSFLVQSATAEEVRINVTFNAD